MNAKSDVELTTLKVDGGTTASELLLQIQADLIDAPVVRPTITETTCLGAAYAAGLAVGFWPDTATLREQWHADRRWEPSMSADRREAERAQWRKAVARSLDWAASSRNPVSLLMTAIVPRWPAVVGCPATAWLDRGVGLPPEVRSQGYPRTPRPAF